MDPNSDPTSKLASLVQQFSLRNNTVPPYCESYHEQNYNPYYDSYYDPYFNASPCFEQPPPCYVFPSHSFEYDRYSFEINEQPPPPAQASEPSSEQRLKQVVQVMMAQDLQYHSTTQEALQNLQVQIGQLSSQIQQLQAEGSGKLAPQTSLNGEENVSDIILEGNKEPPQQQKCFENLNDFPKAAETTDFTAKTELEFSDNVVKVEESQSPPLLLPTNSMGQPLNSELKINYEIKEVVQHDILDSVPLPHPTSVWEVHSFAGHAGFCKKNEKMIIVTLPLSEDQRRRKNNWEEKWRRKRKIFLTLYFICIILCCSKTLYYICGAFYSYIGDEASFGCGGSQFGPVILGSLLYPLLLFYLNCPILLLIVLSLRTMHDLSVGEWRSSRLF